MQPGGDEEPDVAGPQTEAGGSDSRDQEEDSNSRDQEEDGDSRAVEEGGGSRAGDEDDRVEVGDQDAADAGSRGADGDEAGPIAYSSLPADGSEVGSASEATSGVSAESETGDEADEDEVDGGETDEPDVDGINADEDAADETGEDGDHEGSVDDVETVVVDPEVIFEGLIHNVDLDERAAGKAVLQLSPPFRETVELDVYHLDDEEDWSDSFHVRPFRFVREGRGLLEQYPTRELARSELGEDDGEDDAGNDGEYDGETDDEDEGEDDDEDGAVVEAAVDDAVIDQWLEAARERWKGYVRDNMVDVVDVYTRHGILVLDVEYASDDDGD